jgi:hypothetical protein
MIVSIIFVLADESSMNLCFGTATARTEAVAVPAEEPKEAPKETEQDKSVVKLENRKSKWKKWVRTHSKGIQGKTHSNSANTAASAAPPASPVVAASA